jgi:thiol-disulfide isomerase/thioredoxin
VKIDVFKPSIFTSLNHFNMKYSLFVILIFLTATLVKAQSDHAPEALVAMAKKLVSLKSISYQYHRELCYPQDNYFDTLEGPCYMDFDQTDKRNVKRFRVESNDYVIVYNGTEMFNLNKKAKTYSLSTQPNTRSFGQYSLFFNSIQALRSEIPQLIAGDSIPMYQQDTIIDNKLYKQVQLNMRRWMQYMGSAQRLDRGVVFYYRIIIDPVTWLPYQVIQTSNVSKNSSSKTIFTGINIRPKVPDTNSWYYTTYENEYRRETKEKGRALIAAGSMLLPDWSLPEFNGKDDIAFKATGLKGKLVLLDFWIKNCGFCMKSFPELQRLQKTYGGDQFQLLSINSHDKKEDIDLFFKREKPLYKMLYNGAGLAKELGVEGYPTAVLLDKTGKVIYAGEFDRAKLEELIRANL